MVGLRMVIVSSLERTRRSHGLVRAVADGALPGAEELEQEAAALEAKAADCRRVAAVLRQLHSIATGDDPTWTPPIEWSRT